MIKAIFYRNSDNLYVGFQISGHAGFARRGKDIVCSAVSALAINTINSIDKLTDAKFETDISDTGSIKFKFKSQSDDKSQLLVSALSLGLTELYKEYDGKYLQVYFKEV
ncbi:MAG: ribosomal-processing cysteine protease Prp [Lachnospiraceae bacterium]|nr:ribosomal-processing cysteine protease Prp [Lachnospiraceae bacterium]